MHDGGIMKDCVEELFILCLHVSSVTPMVTVCLCVQYQFSPVARHD